MWNCIFVGRFLRWKTFVYTLGWDDIVNIARLLLGFSKLSKTEIKQFTTGMNHYLIASPSPSTSESAPIAPATNEA